MMQQWPLVTLGGTAGSTLHFAGQKFIPAQSFPYGTFGVNFAGCLLMGMFWIFFLKGPLNTHERALLMNGLCGGFTRFSSFTLESFSYCIWQIYFLYPIAYRQRSAGIACHFLWF